MAVRQSTCSRVGTQPNSARTRTKETWIDTSNSCNSIKKIYNMCIVRLKALNRIIVFRSHSTIKNIYFSLLAAFNGQFYSLYCYSRVFVRAFRSVVRAHSIQNWNMKIFLLWLFVRWIPFVCALVVKNSEGDERKSYVPLTPTLVRWKALMSVELSKEFSDYSNLLFVGLFNFFFP